MDEFGGLLDGPRARGAFLLRMTMRAPWSVRIEDEAPLALVVISVGSTWWVPDAGVPVRLDRGDLAVIRGGDPYVLADDPSTSPTVAVGPGQVCTTPDGVLTAPPSSFGLRHWGNDPDGDAAVLVGTYQVHGEISSRLLASLPPLAVVSREQLHSPLPDLLETEMVRDAPGQDVVLDRLLDLLLITTVRAWVAAHPDEQAGTFRAHADPLVGPALRALHHEPARPWTVAALADHVGVSRATMARRFTDVLGQPPMTYLAEWRLALAADLLRETDRPLVAIARSVGYGSPYALSAAFTRARGQSPSRFRSGS